MQEILRPSSSLLITLKKNEVDLADDLDRKRVYYTDGRKLQKPKDEGYQEFAARWEGNRLMSEEKGPGGARLTRSFELSSSGEQLYETVRMKGGQSNSVTVIRYVYDVSGENAQR